MTQETSQFLQVLLASSQDFLRPLFEVIHKPRTLYALFGQMGWNLEKVIEADLNDFRGALEQLQELVKEVELAANESNEDAVAQKAQTAIQTLLSNIDSLQEPLFAVAAPGAADEVAKAFTKDLYDFLITRWLVRHAPLAFQIGRLLSVIRYELATPIRGIDNSLLRLPVPCYHLSLERIWNVTGNILGEFLRSFTFYNTATSKDFMNSFQTRMSQQLHQLMTMAGPNGSDDLAIMIEPSGISIQTPWLPAPNCGTNSVVMNWPTNVSLTPAGEPLKVQVTLAPGKWQFRWITPSGSVDKITLLSTDLFDLSLADQNTSRQCQKTAFIILIQNGRCKLYAAGGVQLSLPMSILAENEGKLSGWACGHVTHILGGAPTFVLDDIPFEPKYVSLGGKVA